MPNRRREKGDRNEYHLRDLHQALGIEAMRHPFSGGLGGVLAGDVTLYIPGVQMQAEVKARREAPRTLVRWLRENDVLFIRPDREAPLVVLPWRTWEKLLRVLQASGGGGAADLRNRAGPAVGQGPPKTGSRM